MGPAEIDQYPPLTCKDHNDLRAVCETSVILTHAMFEVLTVNGVIDYVN